MVEINKRRIYLPGEYGSSESLVAYNQLLAEWERNGRVLPQPQEAPPPITVRSLAACYLAEREKYLVHSPADFRHYHTAITVLVNHFGNLAAADFTTSHLKTLQDYFVEKGTGSRACKHNSVCNRGLARPTVNKYIGFVKSCFKFGALYHNVPATVHAGLSLMPNLRRGHTVAPEYRKITAIGKDIIDQTIPYLPPVVKDMVMVQYYIGGRPQDVCHLRSIDIDRTRRDGNWVYRPHNHKTANRGKTVEKVIVPIVQAILRPYLEKYQDDPTAYLFQPADCMQRIKIRKRKYRRSKVQPSHVDRSKENPERKPGHRYDTCAYNRAIARACQKGNLPKWSPHQLRHAAGTDVRNTLNSIDIASATLGHSHVSTTEIYAELNLEKAIEGAKVLATKKFIGMPTPECTPLLDFVF